MLTLFDPFADFYRTVPARRRGPVNDGYLRPAVDIHERPEAYEILAELPGVSPDNVSVNVEKNVLTLQAERQDAQETTDESTGFRHVERFRGTFRRSFTLPETVDADAIDAKLADGVLRVTLPKRDAPGARKIAVHAA
ncbi:MAG: Hsp20/alpha crystallin family protein [Polyangiales bacterium]